MQNGFCIEHRHNHLHVALAPNFQFTLDASKVLHEATATAAKQSGISRVLIEGESPQCRMNTLEVMELGETVADLLRGVSTAYCLRNYAADHLTVFFDNVVHNRGGSIGFFGDATPAMDWLCVDNSQMV